MSNPFSYIRLASEYVAPLVPTVLPIVHDQRLHREQIIQDQRLHQESIEQDRAFHREEIELEKAQHEEQIGVTKTAHERELAWEKWLHQQQLLATRELHRQSLQQGEKLHTEGIHLAQEQHLESILQSQNLFIKSLEHAEEITRMGLEQSRKLHKDALQHAHVLHREARSIDREFARREEMRDMLSQRTQKTNTLMIVDTLMFGCCFSLLVEGMQLIPENDPDLHADQTWILIVFSIFFSTALCSLFLSVWFAMAVQSRMSKYVIAQREIIYRPCGLRHSTFEEFYRCHCKRLTTLARELFYTGTISVMLCASVLVYCRFSLVFKNHTGTFIICSLIIVTLIILFLLRTAFPAPSPRPARPTRISGPPGTSFYYEGQSSFDRDKEQQSDETRIDVKTENGTGGPARCGDAGACAAVNGETGHTSCEERDGEATTGDCFVEEFLADLGLKEPWRRKFLDNHICTKQDVIDMTEHTIRTTVPAPGPQQRIIKAHRRLLTDPDTPAVELTPTPPSSPKNADKPPSRRGENSPSPHCSATPSGGSPYLPSHPWQPPDNPNDDTHTHTTRQPQTRQTFFAHPIPPSFFSARPPRGILKRSETNPNLDHTPNPFCEAHGGSVKAITRTLQSAQWDLRLRELSAHLGQGGGARRVGGKRRGTEPVPSPPLSERMPFGTQKSNQADMQSPSLDSLNLFELEFPPSYSTAAAAAARSPPIRAQKPHPAAEWPPWLTHSRRPSRQRKTHLPPVSSVQEDQQDSDDYVSLVDEPTGVPSSLHVDAGRRDIAEPVGPSSLLARRQHKREGQQQGSVDAVDVAEPGSSPFYATLSIGGVDKEATVNGSSHCLQTTTSGSTLDEEPGAMVASSTFLPPATGRQAQAEGG